MEKNAILEQVQTVFREELEDETLILTDNSTANDIEDWDSLNHIQLVSAIEKHFGIRFLSREILSWQNIGEMVDSIAVKL